MPGWPDFWSFTLNKVHIKFSITDQDKYQSQGNVKWGCLWKLIVMFLWILSPPLWQHTVLGQGLAVSSSWFLCCYFRKYQVTDSSTQMYQFQTKSTSFMTNAMFLPNPFKYTLLLGQWLMPWPSPQGTVCLNTVGTPNAYLIELHLTKPFHSTGELQLFY